LNFELIRVAAALAGTGASAYQDAKTSFIDDKLTLGMVALGTLLNILVLDWGFALYSIGLTLVIFCAGYLLYRAGQLGGGDVLLFCGIQALLPYYPYEAMAQVLSAAGLALQRQVVFLEPVLPFFVSVYLASSFLGMAISGYIYMWKLYQKTGFRRLRPNVLSGMATLVPAAFIVYYLAFQLSVSPQKVAVVALLLAPAVFLVFYKRDVSEKVALRWIARKDLEDEDIISTEMLPKRVVERYGVERVLTTQQRKVLEKVEKQEGMRRFPVQKDLPRFAPYILAGLVLCLLVPDLLSLLFY
jgi:hypothetical protein